MNLDHLIRLVKERPALYDSTARLQLDRKEIQTLWCEVAMALNCSESEAKNKWHHVRSNFVRERRRLKLQQPLRSDKKWAYYDDLEFLSDHVSFKKSTEHALSRTPRENLAFGDNHFMNLQTSYIITKQEPLHVPNELVACDIDESEATNFDRGQDFNFPEFHENETAGECSEGSANYQKDVDSLDDKNLIDNEDSDRLFLLSLLPYMKQLSPQDNLDTRIEIHEILKKRLFSTSNSYTKVGDNIRFPNVL